jgi:hypothetical protein
VGTPEAIGAIKRIEGAARAWSLVPPTISLDRAVHPASHYGDYAPRPFAQIEGPGGTTYALVIGGYMGGRDVFLTTTQVPAVLSGWSRPLLIPNRAPFGIRDATVTWSGEGRLRLEFSAATDNDPVVLMPMEQRPGTRPAQRQSWDVNIADIRRDTDGDGWTDIEEDRLGTRRDKMDSDDDGMNDGVDVCPMHTPSPAEHLDLEATILKKVFFAAYGIHGSRDVLLVRGNSRPLQLWGSLGPVLYGVDRSEWINKWGSGPPILSWKLDTLKLDATSGDTATVTYADFEASLASAGYTATLRRINGEWVVTKLVMNWIS